MTAACCQVRCFLQSKAALSAMNDGQGQADDGEKIGALGAGTWCAWRTLNALQCPVGCAVRSGCCVRMRSAGNQPEGPGQLRPGALRPGARPWSGASEGPARGEEDRLHSADSPGCDMSNHSQAVGQGDRMSRWPLSRRGRRSSRRSLDLRSHVRMFRTCHSNPSISS